MAGDLLRRLQVGCGTEKIAFGGFISGSECMVPNEDGNKCVSVDAWILRTFARARKKDSRVRVQRSGWTRLPHSSYALPLFRKASFLLAIGFFFPRAPRSLSTLGTPVVSSMRLRRPNGHEPIGGLLVQLRFGPVRASGLLDALDWFCSMRDELRL